MTQLNLRVDGSYSKLYCSNCRLLINENDYMALNSEWQVDQCFDCGQLAIFCKGFCRKEYLVKHTKKCRGIRTEAEDQAVDYLVNKERKKSEWK